MIVRAGITPRDATSIDIEAPSCDVGQSTFLVCGHVPGICLRPSGGAHLLQPAAFQSFELEPHPKDVRNGMIGRD